MNYRILLASTAAIALSACAAAPTTVASAPASPAGQALAAADNTATAAPADERRVYGTWGVDMTAFNTQVSPGEDFDEYVNGGWRSRTEIPDDQASVGTGRDVYNLTQRQLREVISDSPTNSKIGAAYASFMDEARVNTLDIAPLKPRLAAINAVADKSEFARLMGSTNGTFGSSVVSFGVIPNPLNPVVSIPFMSQAGLGLPDREYYLDAKFASQLGAYNDYLARQFDMLGHEDPAATAKSVLDFETAIAKVSWKVADRRNIDKLINPMTLEQVEGYAPGIDWAAFMQGLGVTDPGTMIVAENTAIREIAKVYADTPLSVLKAWQESKVTNQASPYLSDRFVDSRFQFVSKLSGTATLNERWKRGVQLVDGSLGELVGETYVQRHFPASSRAQMRELVANLKIAMAKRIDENSWMAPETKKAAQTKLAKMDVLVGYPDKFRDYSSLDLKPDDLLGNVERVSAFEWAYQRSKLGKAVDRELWAMNPQTVNAYNGGLENKIVFPAGILQAPMFDPNADDAVNYGAIGAVIGHEIIHGFDDQGRKIDETGAVHDWWTKGDAERFDALAEKFGAQYAQYEPVPGHFINPELTMGENIADLAGLQVAYDAYHASLGGKPAPVLDGLTGDQRFFIAFAQAWQGKVRPEAEIQQIASDPHSPARYRVLGPVRNLDAWYQAFNVTPDSPFYLKPEERVRIW